MNINIFKPYDMGNDVKTPFKYKGVKINQIHHPSEDVDIIALDDVVLPVDDEGIGQMIEQIKNHQCYKFSIQNPNIPKLFTYCHEYIHNEMYEKFMGPLCELLNTTESKIIIFDTRLNSLPNRIYHPLENKIKQFDFFDYSINPDVLLLPKSRTKKFTSLMNKVNMERFKLFDRIIHSYDNDIERLRNENTISFRNVTLIQETAERYKTDSKYRKYVPLIFSRAFYDLDVEQMEIVRNDNERAFELCDNSDPFISTLELLGASPNTWLPNPDFGETFGNLYGFKHDKEFFENLELPWLLDYEDINDNAHKFFKTLDIYSTSYFSIIGDSYASLNKDDASFTEKILNPMIVGNLPFLANLSFYYDYFEEVGFDFSYLKELFNIDYKNMNTLDVVFENVDKFISYFKNHSLKEIQEDYNKFKSIADSNQRVLKQIWIDKEPTQREWKFLNDIKQEKFN